MTLRSTSGSVRIVTIPGMEVQHELVPSVSSGLVPGTVILLNGASCSGKTSISNALIDRLDGTWFPMSIDDLNAKRRDLSNRGKNVDDLTTGQKMVLGYHRLIAGFASVGNNVVMDQVLGEEWRLADLLGVFASLRVLFVGVHCPLDELQRRARLRGCRRVGAAAVQFPLVHRHGAYDVEVDTSQFSPAECVAAIVDRLRVDPTALMRLRSRHLGSPDERS